MIPGRGRRRVLGITTSVAVLLAACGGDDGGGTQDQTEEAAVEAAVGYVRGGFTNDPGAVLAFLNEECRAQVDTAEVRAALLLAQAFFSEDDVELSDIEVVGTITAFAQTEATVEIELIPPDGADLGLLELSSDDVDLIYENGRWVGEDCEFGDSTGNSAAELDEALAEAGLAGTRDDPVLARVAAPVGGGVIFSANDFEVDAFDRITAEGGVEPFLEDGHQISLVSFDVGFGGSEEPFDLNRLQFRLVGTDGVAIDQTGCGNMADQLYFDSRELFTGAVVSGVACFAAAPDKLSADPTLSVENGFGSGRAVFFRPAQTGNEGTPVTGAVGPSPDGDLSDERTDPTAVGTAADIDGGWTMTVDGSSTDTTAIVEESGFNEPAPDGSTYLLLDVTLAYDGTDDSASVFGVDIGLVGDSNVAADDDCRLSGVPDELDVFADVFPGGSVSGILCFVVDDADLDSTVAYATGEVFDDDRVFFAIS